MRKLHRLEKKLASKTSELRRAQAKALAGELRIEGYTHQKPKITMLNYDPRTPAQKMDDMENKIFDYRCQIAAVKADLERIPGYSQSSDTPALGYNSYDGSTPAESYDPNTGCSFGLLQPSGNYIPTNPLGWLVQAQSQHEHDRGW